MGECPLVVDPVQADDAPGAALDVRRPRAHVLLARDDVVRHAIALPLAARPLAYVHGGAATEEATALEGALDNKYELYSICHSTTRAQQSKSETISYLSVGPSVPQLSFVGVSGGVKDAAAALEAV